jgi:hypothetical protein
MPAGVKYGGRVAGTPNKATAAFREAVTAVLDRNAEKIDRWLEEVAEGCSTKELKPDPAKAVDMLTKLAEFAVPKLSRIEGHITPGEQKTHEQWLDELK